MKTNLDILCQFNIYFGEGEQVKFNPKAGDFNVGFLNTARLIKQKDFKDKVGTIVECYSDVHSFAHGTSYSCKVDFDGEIIDTMCAAFKLI